MCQADSLPYPLAGASRYAAASVRLPKPATTGYTFARALQQIIAEQSIDLIIPTCEEVFYVATYKNVLAAEVFAPDPDVLRRMHSKWAFNALLRELDLPAPKSLLLESPLQNGPDLFFPAVLKPEFTRFGTAVELFQNEAEWRRKTDISPGRYVWQQYLAGEHWGTYSVARNGHLQAHSAYRLQWRYGAQGAATFFEAADCAEIEAQVAAIAAATQYTGQIAFDFIRRDKDGLFYAIECNPRATSGVHLFSREDDLPRAFLQHNAAIIRPSGPPRKLAVPMLLAAGRQMFQACFWQDWRRSRDAVWSWQDPLPAFQQARLMAYWSYMAFRKGITLPEATTADIAWNGEAIG